MIVTALVVVTYYIYRYRGELTEKQPRGFPILIIDAKEQACAS